MQKDCSRPRLSLIFRLGLAILFGCGAMQTHAIDYRSVATPAILYDVPSDRGKRLFIISAGTPVEIVVSLDRWTKVREPEGALLWIRQGALSDKRTVQITTAQAIIYQQPSESSPIAFEALRNVILDYVEATATGWIKVRHTDGKTGYIRANDIWGA